MLFERELGQPPEMIRQLPRVELDPKAHKTFQEGLKNRERFQHPQHPVDPNSLIQLLGRR